MSSPVSSAASRPTASTAHVRHTPLLSSRGPACSYFAPCPRGLESLLADELRTLGAQAPEETAGGVHFSGDAALRYRTNLHSRLASRILWKVGETGYRSEDDIYRAAHAIDWPAYFAVDCTIKVKTVAIDCPLRSVDFLTLRVKDAICDRFRAACGARPNVDTSSPAIRIHVFLTRDRLHLFLDTSGEALFKRGYRISASGEHSAPLRENLAAGLVLLSGWQPEQPLLDPMCGSGTILVEACWIASRRAPGLTRRFAFERFHDFDAVFWDTLREAARAEEVAPPLQICGSDRDPAAIRLARRTLQAAGVQHIPLREADFTTLTPVQLGMQTGGVLLSNPPYGVRLQGASPDEPATRARRHTHDRHPGECHAGVLETPPQRANAAHTAPHTPNGDVLHAEYSRWGDHLKRHYAGWRAYFFTADLPLARAIRLQPSRRTVLRNGPLECRLFEFRIIAGTMRHKGTQGASTASP